MAPAAGRPRGPGLDLAGGLPPAARADPGPPLDPDLRQLPAAGRAPGRPAQRAGQRRGTALAQGRRRRRSVRARPGGRARHRRRAGAGPPRVDRPGAAPGDRGRPQGRPAARPGGHHQPGARASTWAPSTWSSRSRRRPRWRPACSASAGPATRSGEPSRGRIFPKFRHDLLVAAVVAQRMHAGLIEETRVPRNPLDVLAQQIVAMVAAADEPGAGRRAGRRGRPGLPLRRAAAEALRGGARHAVGALPERRVRRAAAPAGLGPAGRDARRARPGAQMLAVTSGGTIPDRGLFGVFTPEGGRVGELDEEMVYESRVGETFLLGATTWRIEEITRDRVVVTPGPGRARQDAVLARRRRRPPVRAGPGRRAGSPRELGQLVATSELAARVRPRRAGRAQPAGLPRRGAGGHRRAAADRPPDRGRAVPRRARATGGSPSCRRSAPGSTPPGPWPSRPSCGTGSASRSRPSGATTGSSSACPRPRRRPPVDVGPARPRRGRGAGGRRGRATRPCSPPASGRTRPGPCCCPGAGPGPAPRCGSCASGPPTCWRWRRSTARSRSCSRPTGSACATSSTCRP